MPITIHSSVHDVKKVTAHAHLDLKSVPLTISIADSEGHSTEICLHTENVVFAAALMEAINKVDAECNPPAAMWITDKSGLIDTNTITGEMRA